MLTLPHKLTLFQGFDALFHASECYVNNGNENRLTELFAVDAIEKGAKHLPIVSEDGSNLESRSNISYAANIQCGFTQSLVCTSSHHFIAQALGIELSLKEELTLLAVLLLASKGAAGVTGSGCVTLAATLATIPTIPVAGIALILGVDRVMSEARALTNLVGNSVATSVVAKWEGALDMQRLHAELDQPTVIEEEPFLPDDGLLQPVHADK